MVYVWAAIGTAANEHVRSAETRDCGLIVVGDGCRLAENVEIKRTFAAPHRGSNDL